MSETIELITIRNEALDMFYINNGPNVEVLNYPLNENSLVVDFGGYHGIWAEQIITKYNPHIIILEPIQDFYKVLVEKFKDNPKVRIYNYGISTENYEGDMFLNADSTSKYIESGSVVQVKFITITDFLEMINETHIDLIQINIEGEEFPLLEKMISDKTILNFDNLQIQYHTNIDDAMEKRRKIQEKMSEFFNKKYDYPFIWEAWTIK